METNKNNQIILNEHDVVSAWLKDIDIDSAVFKDVEPINIYNQWCDKYDSDGKIVTQAEDTSAEYTETCVNKWHMPNEYKSLDIVQHILGMCNTDEETKRCLLELNLFKDRGMLVVLQFLKYLVDICKEHDIVLGVGRGSSVASYCLFLLGVHRVDSIKYQLDITEFLK